MDFDGWDWDKIGQAFGQTAVPAVTNLVGAYEVGKANQKAGQIGQQTAQSNIAALTAANAPAMQYLNTVTAQNPNQLTPAQVQQMADASRATVTATPTGLRGSGRYLTASINDVQNRLKQGMIQSNTGRVDSANAQRGAMADRLATQVAGQNTAGNYAVANAGTATANSDNAALQNIGSYFANSLKGQNSPYGQTAGTPYGQYGQPRPQQPQPMTLKPGSI